MMPATGPPSGQRSTHLPAQTLTPAEYVAYVAAHRPFHVLYRARHPQVAVQADRWMGRSPDPEVIAGMLVVDPVAEW